ncbi:MarR family winged helix-turn-helix transcriptional regulator [Amycolatopsis sp. H20-H5]|uniref:MarR family winged helix-turn-helix transcriptional regulator n=1 Tax=Amycolatopsis sp. H20-H5 TaxID=3046309 RepID=UPI002DB8B9FB|nr:MarR family transcriptional regulator [Amycolatopsis sp. H20-H5]MEC3980212.1 MarR family transcriptional regulator [Amycolatopsis sp. H20-H5]
MDNPPARLRGKPSWLISQASAYGHRLVTEALATENARRYHYSILAALDEFGPASQATLGRRCGIDRSDVVAMVNELAAQGHLDRTPDDADRRRNVITLTATGRQQLTRLEALVTSAQHTLLDPLSADERRQLTGLLSRVVEHHGLP